MKLTMICHASVLIEAGDVSLLMDPWLVGDAFNESWSMVSLPALKPEALQKITHIWISHEHPDHFSLPTLKSIPKEDKARITVLYQRHFSSRIINVLRKLGFKAALELPLGRWVKIGAKGFEVQCQSVGTFDSLLAVRADGVTVLNVNDCWMNDSGDRTVARRVGRVDVLLTQFSIAHRVGNPEDTKPSKSSNVITKMRRYIKVFRPDMTIPFASFVYFSHEENRYLNRWANQPHTVIENLQGSPTRVQFLYNGDSWSSETGFKLQGNAVEQYRADFARALNRPYRRHNSYPIDEVVKEGQRLVDKVRKRFPRQLFKRMSPIYFYLSDLERAICFDLSEGVREIIRKKEECDIELGSQALWYSFRFPWGFDTLDVSGRFRLINRRVNMRGLYVCHLFTIAFDTKEASWASLLSARSISFWWSKRREVIGRLLRETSLTE